MAKELAHFKNFAKLKDTKVVFNDITVIAGKPGTGKSYVMKFMYAIDETLRLWNSNFNDISKTLTELLEESSSKEIKNNVKKLLKKLDERRKLEKHIDDIMYEDLKNILKSIFVDINQISDAFSFQLGTDFVSYKNDSIEMQLDNFELFKNVIFVETPLVLEFKKFMKRDKGKTPYHIESLLNILDTDYSFTDDEQDKFIKDFTKKSKEIIKGDIESSGDSFIFNKNDDKNYDIVNASSGTKSIGLLQYLVTNKALKKDSVLYWEEPEVHLHPVWQLRMIELFVELMNAGVKIVFSTHSTFMADSLNAISKKEGFSNRVSFNLFKETDGIVENHILEADEKWKLIQDELLKSSLEEIMWQYL